MKKEFNLSEKIVSEKAIRTFKDDSGKSWIEDKIVKKLIKIIESYKSKDVESGLYDYIVMPIERFKKLVGKEFVE